jgi:hypothetical protein
VPCCQGIAQSDEKFAGAASSRDGFVIYFAHLLRESVRNDSLKTVLSAFIGVALL